MCCAALNEGAAFVRTQNIRNVVLALSRSSHLVPQLLEALRGLRVAGGRVLQLLSQALRLLPRRVRGLPRLRGLLPRGLQVALGGGGGRPRGVQLLLQSRHLGPARRLS